MINRRAFIKGSALTGLAAIATPSLTSLFAKSSANSAPLAGQSLRIPSVITGGNLTLEPGTARIYSDEDTNLLLINNSFPAPTIKVKKGDTFAASVKNNLSEDSILHWHGIHAPSAMAGHPKYAVPSGGSYDVSFPIIQRASTNFYHAHPDMNTAKQVYMGMAGLFIVEDDEELALGLPSGEYEVPLMIQDKRFDSNHQMIYSPNNADLMSGWLGDTILVNGTPDAFLSVAPTLYRFRIVNASNSRFFKLAFSDGKAFTIIGNDGGLLENPISLTTTMLSPAERLDVLVDFSTYSQGQNVTLQSTFFTMADAPGSGKVAQGAVMDLIQFQVTKTGSSGSVIPTHLSTIAKYNAADVKRTRSFSFAGMHHVNDKQFSMDRIDANIPLGDLERWTFTSESGNTHPVHVHGTQFQVIDRGVGNPPEPAEVGWKDVVRLDPLGTVNVLLRFTDYTGLFLIHCHKLEHADMGMMANLEVDPQGSVDEKKNSVREIEIAPNPASTYTILNFQSLGKDEVLKIIDEKGVAMMQEKIIAGTAMYALSTVDFANGTYYIILGDKKEKLVVVR